MSNKPAGRPATDAIMLARLNGDKTYIGKQCKKCGGSERYTRGGGSCVTCQRAHSVNSRAALKRLDSEHGQYGGEGAIAGGRFAADEALMFEGEVPPRYFWHPESGSLFTTDGEVPESDGLLEEVDAVKYLTLCKEACFLGDGACPTPDQCEGTGCAGAPSPFVNDVGESAVDKEPEPWD
jgi:hypothetical protein